MKAKLLLIFSLSFYLFSCNGQNSHIPAAVTSAAPAKINRFDKELSLRPQRYNAAADEKTTAALYANTHKCSTYWEKAS